MLFSSFVFLCVFLPLVLFCYYISPVRFRNWVLLAFSFVFYAWGEPKAFLVMLCVIFLNYVFSMLIHSFRKAGICLLSLDLILNLGILIYYKYTDFLISTFNRVAKTDIPLMNIALPIGISFFIFQAISYTIDVYRKQCSVQKNPFKLALYVSLFPQLIAGPIVKYHDVADQIDQRSETIESFTCGLKRLIIGLSKKVLIANAAASVADNVFSSYDVVGASSLWLGAFAYSLQIYFDFSGYSDMAIGLGKMFGFNFLENFNYPYVASSIIDFWRRWHISLSTWFKEYVYIPLGGNRVSKVRNFFNLSVVFFLTGIWHGAAMVFIFWGVWHGFFNVMERITGLNKEKKTFLGKVLMHVYTLVVVLVGWIFFRSTSLKAAVRYILSMFALRSNSIEYALDSFVSVPLMVTLVFGTVLCLPLSQIISRKIELFCKERKLYKGFVNAIQYVLLVCLLVLCLANLAGSTYNPFIYFRF